MEWWQSVISVAFGSVLGYFLTRLGAGQERKSQGRSAMRGMLAEVEASIELAKQRRGGGMLVAFPTDVWSAYKGYIVGLPNNLQSALHQLYLEIHAANAIVQLNFHLPYRSGFCDSDYNKAQQRILERAEQARGFLIEKLDQGGVQTGGFEKVRSQSA